MEDVLYCVLKCVSQGDLLLIMLSKKLILHLWGVRLVHILHSDCRGNKSVYRSMSSSESGQKRLKK